MQEQAKSVAIAVVLTTVDVATFNNYSGVIWRTWDQDPWAKAVLLSRLGLWISSGIVKRHHGRLTFRSSQHPIHHGTIFSLFLPQIDEASQ